MLPYKLEQGRALLAWKCYTEKINESQPVVERKRILKKSGKEQIFLTSNKVFKQTVTATGERLIKLYIRAYERAMAGGFRPESGEDLPAMFTNAVSLAKQCNASDRTMRNHIRKLKKAGLICNYVFHGRKHDFELCISPKILFTTNPKAVSDLFPETSVSLSVGTDFPVNVAFETTGNKEKEISNVDKLGVAEPQAAMPTGDGACTLLETSLAGNTGPQQAQFMAEKERKGGVSAPSLETGGRGAAAAKKQPLKPEFLGFIENFWAYAKHMIYPDLKFDETCEKLAKNAIWAGVYFGFRGEWSDKKWEEYHLAAIERINLASQYYRNNPEKYPPLPYAQWKADTGYFDALNAQGFQQTHKWLLKKKVWAEQLRVSDALRRAKADFIKHRKGKAPKRLQEKSALQLFKFHEEKIQKLGQDALQKFYKQHAFQTH